MKLCLFFIVVLLQSHTQSSTFLDQHLQSSDVRYHYSQSTATHGQYPMSSAVHDQYTQASMITFNTPLPCSCSAIPLIGAVFAISVVLMGLLVSNVITITILLMRKHNQKPK